MTPLERARRHLAGREQTELPSDLHGAVLALLDRDGRHTALSLSLALGRPRDAELYDLLGDLLEAGTIGTDPKRCDFYRSGPRSAVKAD